MKKNLLIGCLLLASISYCFTEPIPVKEEIAKTNDFHCHHYEVMMTKENLQVWCDGNLIISETPMLRKEQTWTIDVWRKCEEDIRTSYEELKKLFEK